MNKRQAKKMYKKNYIHQGNYKKAKQELKAYRQYETEWEHAHKIYRGYNELSEDMKELVEMGIYTLEEVMLQYEPQKAKKRWRQLRKYNPFIIG